MRQPHVAIIGSGFSGLFMAKRCQDLGFTYQIFEKAGEVGGTWRDNRYPGLFIDLPYRDYHMPFHPKHDWDRAFASGAELQQYLVDVAEGIGSREHTVFDAEIAETRWCGDGWRLAAPDGRTWRADAVVAATGFLRVPRIPRIDGADTFAGPSFHSSRWPDGLDVSGKRVGIIGNGSSGIQILSALAHLDCQVTQFIRTPQWIEICPNPYLSESDRELLRTHPDEGPRIVEELRVAIGQDVRLTDPHWKLSDGDLRAGAGAALREDLEIIRDPQLRAMMTPDYEPGCKRIPKSVHYFDAIQRDNVQIRRGQVHRIGPSTVTMADGRSTEVDLIVYATGFDAHAYMRPMEVLGSGGVRLYDVWADGPYSYRGVAVPGFPNFFMLHGPYSPVNNVPVPYTLDHATGYIGELVARGARDGVAFAPSADATERFRRLVEHGIVGTIWAGSCDNWYKVDGRAVIWPWLEKEHRAMFESINLEDLEAVRTVG
jgi:cation diffusion facilitator CzcD-associated flavoprotein CzcO